MTHSRTWSRLLTLATAITALVAGRPLPARADPQAYDLLIQQSPVQAGALTPQTGAHRVPANSSVTLTATPQPPYRFAYWLGDVSDPSAERTTILVNEPKIVIAVFQPDTRTQVQDHLPAGGPAAPDLVTTTQTDHPHPAFSPSHSSARRDHDPLPVAQPVTVPEPATILLLTLGLLAIPRAPSPQACRRSPTPIIQIPTDTRVL